MNLSSRILQNIVTMPIVLKYCSLYAKRLGTLSHFLQGVEIVKEKSYLESRTSVPIKITAPVIIVNIVNNKNVQSEMINFKRNCNINKYLIGINLETTTTVLSSPKVRR